MPSLQDVQAEVGNLGRQVATLTPMVHDMHQNMPRIATALETLARVTEKLESNTEDHKRIHYRITEVQTDQKVMRQEVDTLKSEHLVHMTTSRLDADKKSKGLLARLKFKMAEKVVEWALIGILVFLLWLVLFHLRDYPLTAPIFGAVKR